jgi:hypothetical protein
VRAPSRQSAEKPREGIPDWPANGREFEAIMFGRCVFLKDKYFYSIVIVVPLRVSKFYRVLKKLTAYSVGGHFFTEVAAFSRSIR